MRPAARISWVEYRPSRMSLRAATPIIATQISVAVIHRRRSAVPDRRRRVLVLADFRPRHEPTLIAAARS